jgi:hypothetical protein
MLKQLESVPDFAVHLSIDKHSFQFHQLNGEMIILVTASQVRKSEEASAICSLSHYPLVPCTLSQGRSIFQVGMLDIDTSMQDY